MLDAARPLVRAFPCPPRATSSARGSPLSRALPGWEHREGQLAMAEAVEKALDRETHLFVEAGTGTGKTLAYLVPAVLSGRKVIVSTATTALQEQIFVKDLPLVAEALGAYGVPGSRGGDEGAGQLRVPAALRRGPRQRGARQRSRVLAHRVLARGHRDRRPHGALGPARGRGARGARSPRRARRESARAASTSSAASSRACGARPRRRRSSSSTTTSSSPTSRSKRAARGARQCHPGVRRGRLRRGPPARGRGDGLLRVRVSSARVEALLRDAERSLANANALEALVSGPVRGTLEQAREASRVFFAALAFRGSAATSPGPDRDDDVTPEVRAAHQALDVCGSRRSRP